MTKTGNQKFLRIEQNWFLRESLKYSFCPPTPNFWDRRRAAAPTQWRRRTALPFGLLLGRMKEFLAKLKVGRWKNSCVS